MIAMVPHPMSCARIMNPSLPLAPLTAATGTDRFVLPKGRQASPVWLSHTIEITAQMIRIRCGTGRSWTWAGGPEYFLGSGWDGR